MDERTLLGDLAVHLAATDAPLHLREYVARRRNALQVLIFRHVGPDDQPGRIFRVGPAGRLATLCTDHSGAFPCWRAMARAEQVTATSAGFENGRALWMAIRRFVDGPLTAACPELAAAAVHLHRIDDLVVFTPTASTPRVTAG